jgi:hypothetical protein
MKTCSARKLNHGEIISAPLYWRTEPDLNWRIFFLFGPRLFYAPNIGALINWRVISRKVLFDPHRFLSNKSPIHFPGESGKGNTFLGGKWHVQSKKGYRSPRYQTYAQQL